MSLKILLADDSMTAQNMGKKILSDAGYEVLAVSNGAAAFKKISAGQFDLLLLDVFMPGYTGPEVCAKARELKNYAKTPILFIVGKMEMGAFKVEDAPKLKADGVIIKPFEASDLITAVQKMTAAAAPKPSKPTVPPEAEKTARITPITEETDQSFAQWSATAAEHTEDGQEPEAPPVVAAEMTAETAATAAFAEIEATPAFDVSAGSASAFDLGPTPSYDAMPAESTAALLGLGGAAAEAAEIPLEPATAPAEPAPSFASQLETTPEQVDVGPVAPAPGLELTHAAPVEVKVETAPELVAASRDDVTAVTTDPNFMSDRTEMVSEFATKFSATAGEEISVGVVGEETPAETGLEIPVPAASVEDTAKLTPWVSEALPVFSQSPRGIVSFAPSEQAQRVDLVVDLPAESVPTLMARELEQAIVTASAPEETAVTVEAPPAPPATLEASLEQSLQPEPAAAPVEAELEPMPAEPEKKAGDLEFAQALEAAIASAPEAVPEAAPAPSEQAQAAAAAASSAAVAPGGIPELAGVDSQVVARAVERVLANAKQDIIAEILRELKK